MEHKLREEFTYNGKRIEAVLSYCGCLGCMFRNENTGRCIRPSEFESCLIARKDRLNVIFKEINNKDMEQKSINIEIPEGMEIDKEKSSLADGKIVFKKKEREVRTWEDLINKKIPKNSCIINESSYILEEDSDEKTFEDALNKNYFIDEKHAKSALAMAQISQLFPYYGNMITDEEWEYSTYKYVIGRYNSRIVEKDTYNAYSFLAFHNEEQRDNFLKYNEQLVKDYLMITD